MEGLVSIHSCVLLSDDGCQMLHLWPVRWDKAGLGSGSRIAPHHVWCPGPESTQERLSLEGPRAEVTWGRAPSPDHL